jgi:hypothetical protein
LIGFQRRNEVTNIDIWGPGAARRLSFALQKLRRLEGAIFPVMPRSGEKLAREEQRDCSAKITLPRDDKDVISS